MTVARARSLATIAACAALALSGCGTETHGAFASNCGSMRATVGAFRERARTIVDREGLAAQRLSHEEAVLDAEFRLRRSCGGRTGDEASFIPPSAR